KKAQVLLATGQDVAVEIEEAWAHKNEWVLKFSGVDSIESADKFREGDLWVDRAERGQLGEGEFFQSDLNGCRLIDSRTGKPVGVVEGWQEYGGPPLMEVAVEGRIALLPFVSAECQVDLLTRTILVNVPEGLLEL
ncbi:MAG: ribosome maturation factor RimM, partial [Acidobacteriota bacterium]|nr:ribosome maturation factor RimM [Acidobacteriota bacterium]